MTHELKIWPQYYQPVADGTKTFEVRNNDRAFQKGDLVVLREWDPEIEDNAEGKPKGYTKSKNLTFQIGYVLPIHSNEVVFSLLTVGTL